MQQRQPMPRFGQVMVLAALFVTVPLLPCEAALRATKMTKTKAQDDPFGDVMDTVKDSVDAAGDAVDDTAEAAKDVVDKGAKAVTGGVVAEKAEEVASAIPMIPEGLVRPLMGQINIMRAEMCWARPDLMNHAPCMKFLGLHCENESTGQGICKKFRKRAQDLCASETEADKKKAYCDLAKDLGVKGDPAKDTDGDGIPDDKDPDIDNDGHLNEDDAFPLDAKEWSDLDGDGIGDNTDPDRDGDGFANDKDGFPDDAKRHLDGEGDADGDGVKNSEDAFPDDPTESKDSDGDGIGDNADTDRDGDGHDNDVDQYPDDAKRFSDDSDGDGVRDEEDAFPNDAKEWGDRDGDGIGDNADGYPDNADCHDETVSCDSLKDAEDSHSVGKLNKVEKKLPPQGYNEHGRGPLVEHDDKHTFTGDWQAEWPARKEEEHESIGRICEENPENVWCKRYAVHGHFAR